MLRSDLCDYYDAYLVVKAEITVAEPIKAKRTKNVSLKTMHHLLTAFQR